ncbi:MAG: SEC-C metal-binding domain-containing protein [Bacillota bacterium]|nr:SEC-C metal-binding domain-containing protein [Bacillota bacterium]
MVAKKKIKKNDPCPCGSGKKYRDCCGMDANRVKLDEMDTLEFEIAFDRMLEMQQALRQHLMLPELYAYEEEAREAFETVLAEDDEDFFDVYEDLFWDWFCFDYVPEGGASNLASRYLWSAKLAGEQRKLLQAMIDSSMGLYRLVNQADGLWLLEDLLGGQLQVAYAGEPIQGMENEVGDCLVLRLFKSKEGNLVSPWDWFIDSEQMDYLVYTLQDQARDSNCSDMKMFLKQNSLVFMELLNEVTEAADMPFPTTILFLKDRSGVNERLQAEGAFILRIDEEGYTTYRWSSEENYPNILAVGEQHVLMMSYDEQDLESGKKLFNRCCDDYITDEPVPVQDADTMAKLVFPFIQECAVYEMVFAALEEELGMSPKEAVNDPWGRYQTEEILHQLEYLSEGYFEGLDEGLTVETELGENYFMDTARRLLGIGTMEEDQPFMLVPEVIEDMIGIGRIDNSVRVDPDRYNWSRPVYVETGRLIFEAVKNDCDERQISLLLHAWDEYSGVYLPTVDEPAVYAEALLEAFLEVLGVDDDTLGLLFRDQQFDYDQARMLEVSQMMKAYFEMCPMSLDYLEESLVWDEMKLEEQVFVMMDMCDVVAKYAAEEAPAEAYTGYTKSFLMILQSRDVEVSAEKDQRLLNDIEEMFKAWLAIDVREEGQVSYLERYQIHHSDLLTEVEKKAMLMLGNSQLRLMQVETLDTYDSDEVCIQGIDMDTQEKIKVLLFDIVNNEPWFVGCTVMLRTYQLDDNLVGWEPILMSDEGL